MKRLIKLTVEKVSKLEAAPLHISVRRKDNLYPRCGSQKWWFIVAAVTFHIFIHMQIFRYNRDIVEAAITMTYQN